MILHEHPATAARRRAAERDLIRAASRRRSFALLFWSALIFFFAGIFLVICPGCVLLLVLPVVRWFLSL